MKRVLPLVITTLALMACRDVVDPVRSGARPHFSAASSASWTPVASMAAARFRAAAATGRDGRIYVFGGAKSEVYDNYPPLMSVPDVGAEVYNPATNAWSAIADPGPFFNGVAVRGANGRIYLAGGLTASRTASAEVRSYDPTSNTYSAVAPMNAGRWGAVAAAGLDGKIYVVGGTDGFHDFDSGEVFDPATNTWSPIASTTFTTHPFGGAATGADGRIHAFHPSPFTHSLRKSWSRFSE